MSYPSVLSQQAKNLKKNLKNSEDGNSLNTMEFLPGDNLKYW